MFNIIEYYIKKLTKEDIIKFTNSKDIHLSEKELDFTYTFIKKNYKDYLLNPQVFDINRYASIYTKENFSKITKVYQEYLNKYGSYL